MKNIIIQHWNKGWYGLPEWGRNAVRSIKRYAEFIGVDYELVEGYPIKEFGPDPKPVGQKLCFMNEKYDYYDNTLLLDIDMVYTGIAENVFEHEGVGRLHKVAMRHINASKNGREWPDMYIPGALIFFGNCLKFDRYERQLMRKEFPTTEFLEQNQSKNHPYRPPNDEVVLSWCIEKSGALKNKKVLELEHSKFCDLPVEAHPHATLVHYCGSRKKNIPPCDL